MGPSKKPFKLSQDLRDLIQAARMCGKAHGFPTFVVDGVECNEESYHKKAIELATKIQKHIDQLEHDLEVQRFHY